jgi:hypothetical protein
VYGTSDSAHPVVFCSRIVLCDKNTPLPFKIGASAENEALRSRLKPQIAVCRGRPWSGAGHLWTGIFPSISLLVFSEDSRRVMSDLAASDDDTDDEDDAVNSPSDLLDSSRGRLHAVIGTSRDKFTQRTGVMRYRFHQAYRQLVDDQPGQRLHQFRFQTSKGRSVLESDVWLSSRAFRLDNLVAELVSLLLGCLQTVELIGSIFLRFCCFTSNLARNNVVASHSANRLAMHIGHAGLLRPAHGTRRGGALRR